MLRTVSIPVDLPNERFFSPMTQCAEIFNAHIDWALENKTYNKSKAHHDLYSQLRLTYPDVPSALLQATKDTDYSFMHDYNFCKIDFMILLKSSRKESQLVRFFPYLAIVYFTNREIMYGIPNYYTIIDCARGSLN